MTQNVKQYTAKDISTLDIIDAIRLRPAMYIGSTDRYGSLQCLLEIVTNSVDEAMNGYGKQVDVTVTDETFTVRDFGRGIPFDIKEGET